MINIILKLLSMLVPLGLGYFLKRIHFFGKQDYRIMAKIMMNITLPAAVISSFSGFQMNFSLLGVVLLAFAANCLGLFFMFASSIPEKKDKGGRAMQMICGSGYNMGGFLIPFVQQFLGGDGVAITALFDSGNTFMCTGGNYIVTSSLLNTQGEKLRLSTVLKQLLQPVLIVYFLMVVMALLGIPVPAAVTAIVQPTASANSFVAMLMIGLMFEIHFSRDYIRGAAVVLIKKYCLALVLAMAFYFLLPFDLLTRQVLVMCAFAPIPNISSIFTEQAGGNAGQSSFTTSCSFIISCIILCILAVVMGLV